MIQRCGIILLDKTEITIRIYEIDHSEWKLLQYQNTQLHSSNDTPDITTIIEPLADFLISDGASVSEWRIAARGLPSSEVKLVSAAIGLTIETISPLREQELISKGLFTELW